MATHCSILAWKTSTEEAGDSPWGYKESNRIEQLTQKDPNKNG